jgi:hypothetical protein
MFAATLKALLLAVGVCASEAAPAVEDPSFWADGGASVLYAEIRGYTQPGPGKLTVRPLATLSGELDSAMKDDIVADTRIVGIIGGGQLHEPPAKGAKVILLLCHRFQNDNDSYWIPSSNVSCFPKSQQQPFPDARPALFEVTGFDDPKVTETIENLRKLRGKQREEAEQKAAAEKKGK